MPSLARYMATSAHQTRPALSLASVGRHGDADAGADAGADHVEHEGLLEALGEPLGDRRGVVGVAVDEHDGELVAAEADEQVGVAQRASMSRAPSCFRSWSPAGCPKESLISLKWLRSTNRNARWRLGRRRVVAVGEEESRTRNR